MKPDKANMFHVPRSKSTFVDKLPLVVFPSIWNNMLTTFDGNYTRAQFKRKIKQFFLNEYAEMINCDNPYCPDCR